MNQNSYQTPEQNNQPAPKTNALDAIVNLVIKILPILVIVFVGLGATSLLYYFIGALVSSFGLYGSFGSFITYLATGLSSLAKYCFYAAITAGIYKIAKK